MPGTAEAFFVDAAMTRMTTHKGKAKGKTSRMSPKGSADRKASERRNTERRNDNRRAHDRFSPVSKPKERRQGDRRNDSS
jgi:hypothetical protein